MAEFRDYFFGSAPVHWSPDKEYRILEEVEMGEGYPVQSQQGELRAFIPFCVYSYFPPHRSKFGDSPPELDDVYPYVELTDENGDPIDKRAGNITYPIHLPYNIQKDKDRLIKIALRHINSELNHYKWLPQPMQDKIYVACWEEAEKDLWENPGDTELHPNDPGFGDL